ncbi:MAG: HAD-IA family hydrolase [Rhodospirillaceae bacterium]|jgi:phosphoglycolate phosphatase|nr:HAD-IA family hydrolase [Rhodospirillaceae bacterium]MBT4589631.1 HAD-IA family hydrolase [Rhodospirillaceae bacterium]MBT5940019.1 HAD-IA family hydrolase [Rhodospirillaceae bacterium]MBT7269190.1 HAD-IA family hydrolase [Rhodospirillaceae bacterium]
MITNLLIDLDGTLTNPKPGILNCVRHALAELDEPCPPEDDLLWFIGPPLRESFQTLLNCTEAEAEEAVRIYRERFGTIGLLENDVFEGVPEMLEAQSAADKRLFIASTKPHVYIHPILEHFDLKNWFERIYGSELDGTRAVKTDLLHYIFAELDLDPEITVMIGDRVHDMAAAKAVGVTSIWVDYGYGDEAERDAAKPDHICSSIAELAALLNEI